MDRANLLSNLLKWNQIGKENKMSTLNAANDNTNQKNEYSKGQRQLEEIRGYLKHILSPYRYSEDYKKRKNEHFKFCIPSTLGKYGGTLYKTDASFAMNPDDHASAACLDGLKIYITKVLYNNPATIVFWSDGTQTRNICPPDTLYNPDTGLAFCMLKKLMGNTEMAKLFNDWELKDYHNDKNHYVELKDVRKAHKKGKDK